MVAGTFDDTYLRGADPSATIENEWYDRSWGGVTVGAWGRSVMAQLSL